METWSDREKKLARRVFDAALVAELADVMADFKARAAAAAKPDDMWSIQEHLHRKRREIDEKYDYRYSQLLFVFGRLIREGRIQEAELNGLSDDSWTSSAASRPHENQAQTFSTQPSHRTDVFASLFLDGGSAGAYHDSSSCGRAG